MHLEYQLCKERKSANNAGEETIVHHKKIKNRIKRFHPWPFSVLCDLAHCNEPWK